MIGAYARRAGARRLGGMLWWLLAAGALAGCGPSRAIIDHSMEGGIIWPGQPERPRIRYLWSMRAVMASADLGALGELLAGSADPYAEEGGGLVEPQGVFVDGAGRLYITDTGASRVTVTDLKTMKSLALEGGPNFHLQSPVGVVALPDGRILVSDADLRHVLVFTSEGSYIGYFGGRFERPTGLALDLTRGNVYIADTWGHQVYIYSLEGTLKGTLGQRGKGQGELNFPTHLAVGPDGTLHVSDTLNFRVQRYEPAAGGKYLGGFGVAGEGYGDFEKLKGIAVDREGHIYVTDSVQDMVKIYDSQGRLLLYFGQSGSFYGQFSLPTGIFIDANNRIYVADMLNHRLQAFEFLGGGE